jgi:hypothetical protein
VAHSGWHAQTASKATAALAQNATCVAYVQCERRFQAMRIVWSASWLRCCGQWAPQPITPAGYTAKQRAQYHEIAVPIQIRRPPSILRCAPDSATSGCRRQDGALLTAALPEATLCVGAACMDETYIVAIARLADTLYRSAMCAVSATR